MGHIAERGSVQFRGLEYRCTRASDGLSIGHAGLSVIDGADTVNANAEYLNATCC